MRRIFTLIILAVSISGLLYSFLWNERGKSDEYRYHPDNYMAAPPPDIQELPYETNTLFSGSGNCILCHGDPSQFPDSEANLDAGGNDVSPITTWRATMMANAAKDPFWRAKVSHEGLVNPGLKDEIENVCTTCHGPNGHFEAVHLGQLPYTMADLKADPMALDGVSCMSCHTMTNDGFGSTFSGNITYDVNKFAFGPYPSPNTMMMYNMTGVTPAYGSHIPSSEMCAKCHTLITSSLDDEGQPTGESFVEQAVYHEWLNSIYEQEGTSCIDCHMKTLDESVVVSPLPSNLAARSPFSKHTVAGGNVFMLNLLKNNIIELDLNATSAQFQSVIEETQSMLQSALELNVYDNYVPGEDTVTLTVELVNKAGHKLPSGYPSRKMHIELLIVNYSGDTLFHSGAIDSEGRIIGESDDTFEPHYTQIVSDDQVQIYELAMGDVNGNLTTVLEYAYQPLKDNRIPPAGFVNSHPSIDTIPIVGAAYSDPDFNRNGQTEGTGSDRVDYKIALDILQTNAFVVYAKVHYMSVPRKWLDEMFAYNSDDIDQFKSMYDFIDTKNYVIAETELNIIYDDVAEYAFSDFVLFPNPVTDRLNIRSESGIQSIEIYDTAGRLTEKIDAGGKANLVITPGGPAGNYHIKLITKDGREGVKQFIKR